MITRLTLHLLGKDNTPHINYQGYRVFYSIGTSLIERFRKITGGIYEEETSKAIVNALSQSTTCNFIDIGANIGLISYYVANHLPHATIFAFEPGPHQYSLLQKTVHWNNLENRIFLYPIALSNQKGFLDFHVHSSQDVSGDGFLDTGRAGPTTQISVSTMELDAWWNDSSRPQIDVIKIDTEGAELWVLQGATSLIKQCNPVIITEICHLNYKRYPYSEFDVLAFLENFLGYTVYTEQGAIVSAANLASFQSQQVDTYICKPQSHCPN
jgi:FkbM family methyltransferase